MSNGISYSFEYSTQEAKESERFTYWSEVVMKHCLRANSNTLNASSFEGKLRYRKLGLVDICTLDSNDHIWCRNADHVRQTPDDDLWLGFFQTSHGRIEQGGRRANIRRGDLVLYDSAQAFEIFLGGKSSHLIRIPRYLISKQLPNIDKLTAQILSPNRPGIIPLREMLQHAVVEFQNLECSNIEKQYSQSIIDLLTLGLEKPGHKSVSIENDLYSRAMLYIEDHLSDPELNLKKLALVHHVSTRTLTRAFNRHQKTPVYTVWQIRLQASREAIERGESKSISEIALKYGFNDFSHFSHSFRKAFSISPSELLRKNNSR